MVRVGLREYFTPGPRGVVGPARLISPMAELS